MIERLRKLCLFLLALTGLFTLSGCNEAEYHVYVYECGGCRTVTIPRGLEITKFDCVVNLTNAIVNIEYTKKKKIESEEKE